MALNAQAQAVIDELVASAPPPTQAVIDRLRVLLPPVQVPDETKAAS
jgi:hypothetical protein